MITFQKKYKQYNGVEIALTVRIHLGTDLIQESTFHITDPLTLNP